MNRKLNKKCFFALIAVMAISVFFVSGCSDKEASSGEENSIIEIDPTSLLPIESAAAAVGYDLVTDGVTVDENGTKTALYRTEPIGQADIVKISVRQYSQTVSKDEIRTAFETARSARSDAETVDATGVNAYIAFPSLFVYYDGYLVTITAGSGSDDAQRDLLISLASTTVTNLGTLLSV